MTGAIIAALMHRIPSVLRSQACLGGSSTRMGDLLGSPRAAALFLVWERPFQRHRSHQNSAVKRAWARVVLGWVTSWEVHVLHTYFCIGNGRFSDIALVGAAYKDRVMYGSSMFVTQEMTGAIIPALMHRIPSELRSQACLGESSTRMGDLLGSPPLVGAAYKDEVMYGSSKFVTQEMTGAIIPALMHRIPSELRSEACLGESSTRMGDLMGSPRVAPLFLVWERPFQ
ncbi:hypothetical protein V6N12_046600 [Hibiscus sabdariffa]|uniref:Uncharacterized protein n=1 Tax=Hibiscus sabdariffa TaxID=183260 RepID=A0ABR2DJ37_9ROSI